MAFSTDYSSSGLFYVYLTPKDANPGAAPFAPIQLREYRRSASDPDRADPVSGRTVLTIPHPNNTNHYGGTLQFGPDGRLYMGTGDGGGTGDPAGNAQNPDSMLGKLLRLDPRADGSSPYRVLADNPYAGTPSRRLVWSMGLRNPFRFSFDRAPGALEIGDVGQGRYEEVDSLPAPAAGRGVDFGWNRCEGTALYPSGAIGSCPASSGLTGPVFTYDHAGGRCSITGGVVSRDPGVPSLAGRYLYADYCGGDIRSQVPGSPAGDVATGLTGAQPVAFGEDACGRVHLVRLGGEVARIAEGAPGECVLQPEFSPPSAALEAPGANPPAQPAVAGPLRVRTRISRRQRVLRRRRLTVRVACSAACSLRVSSSLRTRGRRPLRLHEVRDRGTGLAATVTVPLGPRARRAIRSALRRHRRVVVRLTLRAGASGGPPAITRLSTRIVG